MNKANEQNILGAGIIIACIATVIFCTWAFPQIDCHNAQNGLEYIAACEASDDCELRETEKHLKQAYTRLEIKTCPKD